MEPTDRYFIFENRVDSFQVPHVVPGKGKAGKTLVWPHKVPSPIALAKAGFFYEPHLKSPDNVVCFLCEKSLDGWEENDNPVEEHLKHSPTCGWAIMAAIETGYGSYGKVHPLDPAMVEARKATFADRWPYESKKNFKCKTKKLVEGGWKYTPSLEADDMTTCAYCDLALEGWESGDNPFDEHYKRRPGCAFFALLNQYPAPKRGRVKAARTSRASRLSMQSVATVATTASDPASAADLSADHDDSVLTTASTMTQGGKKTARGRKPAASRGRKTKVKNEEAVDILEDVEQELRQSGARGRKRASDAIEDPSVVNAEAPATKKRATKARASTAADTSSILDTGMGDALPAKQPASRKRVQASTAKTARMTSRASLTSQASTASLRAQLPDDDELERQLEADLERYNSDADGISMEQIPPPAKGRPKKAATARKVSAQKKKAEHDPRVMLDPTPMAPDDAEIEADFEAIRAGMEVEQTAAADTLVVPKKGRKAGARKVSKQTSKAKEPDPPSEPAEAGEPGDSAQAPARDIDAQQPQPDIEIAPAEDPDASTETVLRKPVAQPSNEKRRRGRPSKKSTASQASVEASAPRPSTEAPGNVVAPQSRGSTAASNHASDVPSRKSALSPLAASVPATATPRRSSRALATAPPSSSRLPHPPSTPLTRTSLSTRSNNQTAATTRTRSPQFSDTENLPPTSLPPSASVHPKRVVLAPLDAAVAHQTPSRSSPSRRNIISGLQSSHPWEPADLELIFSSSPVRSPDGCEEEEAEEEEEDKENGHGGGRRGVARLLRKGAELTTPEKRMTVEQWIYHNAELAEQKLKRECEAMVAAFEAEGMRALKVLEGLVVDA
ncbi:hypothetical protein VTH06DRAFT_222 [Thermothelomyces fergusii]